MIDLEEAGRDLQGIHIRITGTGTATATGTGIGIGRTIVAHDHDQDRGQGVDPDERSMLQGIVEIVTIGIITEDEDEDVITMTVIMSKVIDSPIKVTKLRNQTTTKYL